MQIIIRERCAFKRKGGKEKRSRREARGDYLIILQLK